MTDQYNTVLMLWLLLLLIGCWLVANALLDLGARYVRRRISDHFTTTDTSREKSS